MSIKFLIICLTLSLGLVSTQNMTLCGSNATSITTRSQCTSYPVYNSTCCFMTAGISSFTVSSCLPVQNGTFVNTFAAFKSIASGTGATFNLDCSNGFISFTAFAMFILSFLF